MGKTCLCLIMCPIVSIGFVGNLALILPFAHHPPLHPPNTHTHLPPREGQGRVPAPWLSLCARPLSCRASSKGLCGEAVVAMLCLFRQHLPVRLSDSFSFCVVPPEVPTFCLSPFTPQSYQDAQIGPVGAGPWNWHVDSECDESTFYGVKSGAAGNHLSWPQVKSCLQQGRRRPTHRGRQE